MCHVFLTDIRRLTTIALRTLLARFDMEGNGLYGSKNLFKISLGALK
jgi:hypothetical protein